MATTTVINEPMKELDEWDDFAQVGCKQGKSEEEFRNYKPDANPGVTEFSPAQPFKPDARLCAPEEGAIWAAAEGLEKYLGSSGIFEYAGG